MEGPIDLGGRAMEGARSFYACYLLSSMSSRFKGKTYIGFTVNPLRRLRQHNGEMKSGAFRTREKRPWEMILCVYGFPTQVHALQFEWAWQHPFKSLAVREAAYKLKPLSGVCGKIKLVYTMLSLPEWKSFNLTINFLSTKHISYTKNCPALPPHMRVTIAPLGELPCYQAGFSEFEDGEMGRSLDEVHDPSQSEDILDSTGITENNTSKKTQHAYKQKRLQSISSNQDPQRGSIKNIRETDESIAESTDIDSVVDPNLSPFFASRILKHYDENVHDFPGSSCNQLLYDQLVHDLTRSENVLDSSGVNEKNISKETQQASKRRKLRFASSSKDPKRVSKGNLRETDENVVESTDVNSFFDTDLSPFLASHILKHTDENINELPGSSCNQLVFDLNYQGEDCKRSCCKTLEKGGFCSKASPDGRSLMISPFVLTGDFFQSDFSIRRAPGSTSTDTTSSSPALLSRELSQSVDSCQQNAFAVSSSPIKEQRPKRLPDSSLGPCAPCIPGSTIAVSPFTVISIASSPESCFEPREIIDLTDSPFLW